MNRLKITLVLLVSVLSLGARAETARQLPSSVQKALKKGTLAAGQKQWTVAIRYFEEARKDARDAPEPLFNLGLAEAQMPGRELRAIAWFHAYLALAPDAPNAAAVRAQIESLDIAAEGRATGFLTLLKQLAAQFPARSNEADEAKTWAIAEFEKMLAMPVHPPMALPDDVSFTVAQRAEVWTNFVSRELAAPLFVDYQTTLTGIGSAPAGARNKAWAIFTAAHSLATNWLARLIDIRRCSPEADFIWQSRSRKVAAERQASFPKELVDVTAFAAGFAKRSGITLVPIPPGEFMFGGDEAHYPTRVTISRPFLLGATEVTQAQWQAVMKSNPSNYKGDTLPVEYESWEDANAFCKKLTEQERTAGRLSADWEFTLPTDAQWEYAYRAGTTANYIGDIEETAWYRLNSGDRSHPVGTKRSNAWGLYDMRGNLAEFCLDSWDTTSAPFGESHLTDPRRPNSGSGLIVRGGSYTAPISFCCPDWRSSTTYPSATYGGKGFRVALCLVR